MRALIVFGTTEGHTRDIAAFIADRLRKSGHQVQLCDVAQSDLPDPAGSDVALLAASLHIGRYQADLAKFARENHRALNNMRSAFISVSLSAVGDDPADLAGLHDCVKDFELETGWHPNIVHHAAGAMLFSAYGFPTKLAIKFIARRHGKIVNTSQDYDLTDYGALGAFMDRFMADASVSGQKRAATAK